MASVTNPDVFSISTSVRGDVLVVTVSGEVDLTTAPELTRAIHLTSAHTSRLVADLAGVTFLDSSGLNALVRGCRALEERGIGFRLVADPGGPVRRLLDLTQLLDLLHVVDAFEDAVADDDPGR
jgi:anti-sigma B factor antagonist